MKSNLQRLVEQAIARHQLLEKGKRILVALSGGADSVALLLVLHELQYDVMALHCNFHLRGEESMRDENFVRDLCTRHGIELRVKEFDTLAYCQQKKVSIEMGARELRYTWFEQVCIKTAATAICVAHHRQDQAETVLLNLVRGTGLRGMAGMHWRNAHIVRPMLDCTKQDILDYLHAKQQTWVDDSTNAERDALRNRIRLDIIPLLERLNPQAVKNIAMTATHMQEALPIYERGLNTGRATTLTELHEALLGCGFNATQESNIWTGAVGSLIESDTHVLLKTRTQMVLMNKSERIQEPTLQECIIERERLTVMKAETLYLDADKVLRPLSIRPTQQADRMTPFGMKGSRLVSDMMTDRKMNRLEKEEQHVLTDGKGQIVWLIGVRASDLYKVGEETRNVLCIEQKNRHSRSKTTIEYGTQKD